ncbi:PaaI family thioesterase [Paracoccus sp. (in: a-proteobacteria)]|uniref:PaaI family thioesterase n=1 Tax=Paracoccus sp. TaxID=267 RepID=UPI0026E011C2|nr:PaaI family thioesterase [Paracoccus sp. (in: a-proteobacteria)]MDO5648914.1 PaaI family thioesterase [Paracoccus sp. (in: a-proteobacteria)]
MRERIQASFDQQSFMTSIGARLTDVAQGRVTIECTAGPGFSQQQGFAHAALTFAIGDSAAGYAALTVAPPDHEVLTSEIKINLLAPAKGHLIAEGRVIKPGRRLIVVASDVWAVGDDGARIHVAMMQGTIVPVAVKG